MAEGAISVKDAVKWTGFGRAVLYRAMADGSLPYVQRGARKVIPKAELRRFLADRLVLK